MVIKNVVSNLILLIILLCTGNAMALDIAVIVNNENANDISREIITEIYSGNRSKWPSGGSVIALKLSDEHSLTRLFFQKVVGKKLSEVKDLWAQNVLDGKASPPRDFISEDEVKKFVAKKKNAIGYINSSNADSSVKVILKIQ